MNLSMRGLGVEGVLTFFYYDDIEKASEFYRCVMGFERVMNKEWVKIYKILGGSHVGLVNGERGSHKPNPIKPVRLQIIVSDADTWFRYLKGKGLEIDRDAPHVGTEINIKAFSVKDPEGYTIEICEYTTPYGL